MFLFSGISYAADAIQKQSNEMLEFTTYGFEINIGKSPSEAIKVLGKPKKHEITKEKNKYYDVTDEIHTLYYKGGEFRFYVPDPSIPVHGFPIMFAVETNDYPIKFGVKIGSSHSEITKILGMPVETINNVFVYYDNSDASNYVYIHFKENKVSKIEWHFYTG